MVDGWKKDLIFTCECTQNMNAHKMYIDHTYVILHIKLVHIFSIVNAKLKDFSNLHMAKTN